MAPQATSGLWSIERVVALLTPIFSGAAGWLTTLIGTNIPGVNIPKADFVALFATGALAAAAAALKWLHGRQKFVSETSTVLHGAVGVLDNVQSAGGAPLADIEKVLQAHEANIIHVIGNSVGVPASAEEIAGQIVRKLWPRGATADSGAAPGA